LVHLLDGRPFGPWLARRILGGSLGQSITNVAKVLANTFRKDRKFDGYPTHGVEGIARALLHGRDRICYDATFLID